MRRIFILALAVALLLAAAAEEAGYVDIIDELVAGMNENLEADEDHAGGILARTRVGDGFAALSSGDGHMRAYITPTADGAMIDSIAFICDDANQFPAVMLDTQYLAYYYGSRDSIEAVAEWTDGCLEALTRAFEDKEPMETDICDVPAFVAQARIVVEDGAARLMMIVSP